MVCWLMTGETVVILEVSSGSRGCSFGPRKVYSKCKRPRNKMTAALAATNAEEIVFFIGSILISGLLVSQGGYLPHRTFGWTIAASSTEH